MKPTVTGEETKNEVKIGEGVLDTKEPILSIISTPENDSTSVAMPPIITQQAPEDREKSHAAPAWSGHYLWSILTTICCFGACSVVGLVHFMSARTEYKLGNVREAMKKKRQAKCWSLSAVVIGIIATVVVIVVVFRVCHEWNSKMYEKETFAKAVVSLKDRLKAAESKSARFSNAKQMKTEANELTTEATDAETSTASSTEKTTYNVRQTTAFKSRSSTPMVLRYIFFHFKPTQEYQQEQYQREEEISTTTFQTDDDNQWELESSSTTSEMPPTDDRWAFWRRFGSRNQFRQPNTDVIPTTEAFTSPVPTGSTTPDFNIESLPFTHSNEERVTTPFTTEDRPTMMSTEESEPMTTVDLQVDETTVEIATTERNDEISDMITTPEIGTEEINTTDQPATTDQPTTTQEIIADEESDLTTMPEITTTEEESNTTDELSTAIPEATTTGDIESEVTTTTDSSITEKFEDTTDEIIIPENTTTAVAQDEEITTMNIDEELASSTTTSETTDANIADGLNFNITGAENSTEEEMSSTAADTITTTNIITTGNDQDATASKAITETTSAVISEALKTDAAITSTTENLVTKNAENTPKPIDMIVN